MTGKAQILRRGLGLQAISSEKGRGENQQSKEQNHRVDSMPKQVSEYKLNRLPLSSIFPLAKRKKLPGAPGNRLTTSRYRFSIGT
jgi:hypothetical protein